MKTNRANSRTQNKELRNGYKEQQTTSTTDKPQLKHRGINTQADKLNKITRGCGKSETPVDNEQPINKMTRHMAGSHDKQGIT